MNLYDQYYLEKLYPLQDGVMSIIGKLGTPFFLTGGTALSRHYSHHRYSDDLDLFVNADPRYPEWVDAILKRLFDGEKNPSFILDRALIRKFENFTQLFVSDVNDTNCVLKIDLVNDVAPHYGTCEIHQQLGSIDSWRNILSNKISALFRFEPKDIADLWILALSKEFRWSEILDEAKTKEVGVDPEIIYNILKSFPVDRLDIIRWVQKPDYNRVKENIDRMADDLFYGRNNTLASDQNNYERTK